MKSFKWVESLEKRSCLPAWIDTDQPGFKKLKIKELCKAKSHAEIYKLLVQV
jgi:hypothetical protein